jgi:hypothetical protein
LGEFLVVRGLARPLPPSQEEERQSKDYRRCPPQLSDAASGLSRFKVGGLALEVFWFAEISAKFCFREPGSNQLVLWLPGMNLAEMCS